jgi:uncharacterized protein (TIGR02118 family)
MIRVTALYPKTATSRFDKDYYLNKHILMVKERLTPTGLLGIGADEGLGTLTPGEPPAYEMIGYLEFASVEDLQKSLAAHGAEIIADIANYTDVQPIIQVNRIAQPIS